MSGVTGIGTTFNLPNYHGELFALTPADTPLLSAAGGIGGGQQTDSTAFEWQTYDLRDAASRPRLEGADAPTAEERVRANVENVVQIFHEAVATSYTKQAATGQYSTPTSAPFISASGVPNPVGNEHAWQIMQSLKQIARDVNFTFWHGTKVKPTDNSTARQTAGLLSVMSSNTQVAGAAKRTGATSATDTITVTHSLVVDDKVVFTSVGASTTIVPHRAYWVVQNSTTASFKVSATKGGTPITVGTATGIDFYEAKAAQVVTPDVIGNLLQSVFDNGGITEQGTATLFVPSGQKRAISKAYATAYSSTAGIMGGTRNVGGVSMDTIVTDFGTLNIVVDRVLPADAIAVVSLEQIDPVFLNVPNKGVLFEEELAKTGAADRTQIYGEIGLKYGNQAAHGVVRGLFA
ncbi:SU10 major capsid protein [Nocardia sp. CY41]|uniref:SU10 major capsid protein n=1 Tax=Nocardia sp. CY41 TaxID=2608686 RepID=UPI00135A1F9D|nr:DUF5309 family protein [Nocardia sp. CY41]